MIYISYGAHISVFSGCWNIDYDCWGPSMNLAGYRSTKWLDWVPAAPTELSWEPWPEVDRQGDFSFFLSSGNKLINQQATNLWMCHDNASSRGYSFFRKGITKLQLFLCKFFRTKKVSTTSAVLQWTNPENHTRLKAFNLHIQSQDGKVSLSYCRSKYMNPTNRSNGT